MKKVLKLAVAAAFILAVSSTNRIEKVGFDGPPTPTCGPVTCYPPMPGIG